MVIVGCSISDKVKCEHKTKITAYEKGSYTVLLGVRAENKSESAICNRPDCNCGAQRMFNLETNKGN